jgi:hypothetical protein
VSARIGPVAWEVDAVLAAPPLAVSAYDVGTVLGALLPLVLGIALLVAGIRQRRAAAATPETTTWSPVEPAPGWPTPEAPSWPAPAPTKPGGNGLIIAGWVLTAIGLVSGTTQTLQLLTTTDRNVALPRTVLGLERVQGNGAQIAESALQAAPKDLIDPHAALYGTPGLSVLVIAARAHTSSPSVQIDSFREGFEGSGGGRLTDGRGVPPGKLGGAARCWVAHISGTEPGVCIFVDRGSLVATIDFLPGGVEEAAKRGLQIREATVHET